MSTTLDALDTRLATIQGMADEVYTEHFASFGDTRTPRSLLLAVIQLAILRGWNACEKELGAERK